MSRFAPALLTVVIAFALAAGFWWPLFTGGGFIGGDNYTFFLPQKQFYAETLNSGGLPLWNNRVGHGYPVIGESQTGALYPFHLLFYSACDLQTAYNANHLLHYVLAFVFMTAFARSLGLGCGGSLLAALVYAYGWFPARNSLEWAIITGAWLPAALWCVEKCLQTRHWRYGIGLSSVLAVQMLAGHFHLAFLTQLLLIAYVPARLWWMKPSNDAESIPSTRRMRLGLFLYAMIAAGFALAAVQLLPTLAFKRDSQRATTGDNHRLAQGSMPAEAWSQAVAPWTWYSPAVDRNAELNRITGERDLPTTNLIEAHLYFGLIPLALALIGLVIAFGERRRWPWFFAVMSVLFLLYTPGWILPVTQHLPGFSFFQGPGRYGLVTTFCVAMLAGYGIDRLLDGKRGTALVMGLVFVIGIAGMWWLTASSIDLFDQVKQQHPFELASFEISEQTVVIVGLIGLIAFGFAGLSKHRRTSHQVVLATVILAGTALDLWIVSRLTMRAANTPMIADPPIAHLDESPLRKLLNSGDSPPRLYAPGGNLVTLFGCSSYPPYLTFGPSEYSDAAYQMPDGDVAVKIQHLNRLGITHILTFEELDKSHWPVTLKWQGIDPVFNRALAASNRPVNLYEFHPDQHHGRVFDQGKANARLVQYSVNRVDISVQPSAPDRVVLTDLATDDWTVLIDGDPAEWQRFKDIFLSVNVPADARSVVWLYRPAALYWGAAISLLSLLIFAAIAHVRFWHPNQLRFLDPKPGD